MNILNLLKYFPPYPGGIENIACDLIEELAARGVQETVLSHGSSPYTGNSDITQILSRNYGEFLYTPVSPSFPVKLHKALKHGKYDLMHIHLPNVSAFWPLFMKIDIPIVIHWHSDVLFPREKRLCRAAYTGYALFEKALLKKASAIVPTSEAYMEYSRPLKNFRDKCRVIPLGLNFSRMTPVSDFEKDQAKIKWCGTDDCFLVAAAGRFSHYKGFEHLIDAASSLENCVVVIAGDGEMRAELLRRAEKAGLAGKVVMPGRLSDRDLHLLMASCDAFCLPSVERTEAFGVVLLEAMFYGKALITTDIKGSATSWVNQSGETGLVVPVKDSAALGKAVKQLQEHPDKTVQMGLAGQKRLYEKFSIVRTADGFHNLYQELL
ncbi:glycosyltransferase [Maridesulfovibrio bastinii]|uniref:glycosyltransferase n=1 Tax=Maridesulfovibrio bastinii TaxID=47157 RepID=UPI000414B1DB|nr:glycosyltransferase [Maridesulfovibrio bastinii]